MSAFSSRTTMGVRHGRGRRHALRLPGKTSRGRRYEVTLLTRWLRAVLRSNTDAWLR
jgi:hypothetical protein